DDDDDEEESLEDDEDDEMDIEADEEEEEEEHPAPADSIVVAPTATDQAPSAEETEPFETDELSPPLPILSPAPPPSPIRSLGYRAAMIRLQDEAASTSSPPLQLPSASRKEGRHEVTLPPRKRLDIALGPRYEVGESSSVVTARPAGGLRVDYGFVSTMDREIGAPVSTDAELGIYVREFETRVRQDTDEIYMRLDDEQTERQLLAGRLNMLFRDRRAYAYTRHLMETEARMIDHRRSTKILELRTALQEQVTALQGQVTALQAHVTTLQGQQGLAGSPTQSGLPEEVKEYQEKDKIRSKPNKNGKRGEARKSKWMDHPRNEIKKLEMELWDLKVKGTYLASYTQRYQELDLLCGRMFSEESDKIEKYVGGLPDMIHGSVVASKPKTMQEGIEIATELMDKKIRTFVERETASKRKFENTSRNTQNQQQQHSNKRQNTSRVYTAASGEKKQYGGSRPLCAKCNYHHDGPCALKCRNCNKIGHSARDCRSTANTNDANNQRGTGSGQRPACYDCGVQGHFKRECPKLKNNNNHGNQGGRNNTPARVYAVKQPICFYLI
nr:hypothetical protein [Tanacetum cinerariifolium]